MTSIGHPSRLTVWIASRSRATPISIPFLVLFGIQAALLLILLMFAIANALLFPMHGLTLLGPVASDDPFRLLVPALLAFIPGMTPLAITLTIIDQRYKRKVARTTQP